MSVDEDKQPRRTSTTAANQRNRAEKTSPKPKQKQMVKPIDETVMCVCVEGNNSSGYRWEEHNPFISIVVSVYLFLTSDL